MSKEAINAALDKKAENAKSLGLDYEPAQQELDPLAGNARDDWNDWRDDQGVYPTALNPPERTWVGLTDADFDVLTRGLVKSWVLEHIVRNIEAKLKEKNT